MIKMKYIVLLFIVLLIFTTTFAAEYTVPRAAYSVYAEDLDLDGDIDIVVGHKYNWQTEWGGVSILKNIGDGLFYLSDSLFFINGYAYVNGSDLDNNNYIDLLSQYVSNEPAPNNNRYICVIYNYGYESFNNICYFPLNTREAVHFNSVGDIDNDNDIDIVVASNGGQFWGVLYNDGTGQFSEPEYHYVAGVYPTDIECGNLNEDDREDILVSGQEVRIYYSYPSGFDCYIVNEDPEIRVEIADMDNDGDNDIVGVSEIWDIISLTMYENMGEYNFYEHNQEIFEIWAPYFRLSDLNNDSLPDIVCSGTYGVYILYNEGDLNLSDPQYFSVPNTSGLSRPPFCADLDGNGYNDIITIRASFYTGILNILFNDGNGNFVEEPQVGINEECIMNNEKCRLTNYPNPFNPDKIGTTTISFNLAIPTTIGKQARIDIYNIKGQLVKKFLISINQSSIVWNGRDESGKQLSSGIYLYRFSTGKKSITKKMLLMR